MLNIDTIVCITFTAIDWSVAIGGTADVTVLDRWLLASCVHC